MSLIKKFTKLEKEAEDFGFKWSNYQQIIDQIRSECDEVDQELKNKSIDNKLLQEELGDLMHAVFSLTLFLKQDPYLIMEQSIEKFYNRFQKVKDLVKADGLDNLKNYPEDRILDYWYKAKEKFK